jgi:predicted AlkP superfamily pyrophosphatase or phosphodiesterase
MHPKQNLDLGIVFLFWLKLFSAKKNNVHVCQCVFPGLYTDLVDFNGHRYTVYSERHNTSIRQLDSALNHLVDELETRNLTDTVDVILVSDHGMTDTAREKLIYLVDYISECNMTYK